MSSLISIAAPYLIGNEKKYVDDCMSSGWISSAGKYVELFENSFAEFCGVRHAVACCNGTVALHLALVALGVGKDDEVIVPTLTFVATANAVAYCGATPVFVDSEQETWNLDPAQVEGRITPRTKGIIAVHLYGHPAKMKALKEIASRHKIFLLEDAAEAHGAICEGQMVGSIGEIASFSFYANKIITTGEGGMVVTNDDRLAELARLYHGQGMSPDRRYWFPVIGYNYRMMNLPAAIGLAQLEKIDEQLELRQRIAARYKKNLQNVEGLFWQEEQSWAHHVFWMFNVVLDSQLWGERDDMMKKLSEQGIETRPVFYPLHTLPPYAHLADDNKFPVANHLAQNGISLPTWGGLQDADIDYICESLLKCKDDSITL